jgi:hypothetical protein
VVLKGFKDLLPLLSMGQACFKDKQIYLKKDLTVSIFRRMHAPLYAILSVGQFVGRSVGLHTATTCFFQPFVGGLI